jgi:hypothetical protein
MAIKNKTTETVSVQLREIELTEVNISLPSNVVDDRSTFQFNINIEHRLIPDQGLLMATIKVNINLGEVSEKVGSITCNTAFFIHEMDGYKHEGGVRLPEAIVNMLNSIALSTTRGIMYSEFRGTRLSKALLPIVDPSAFKFEPAKN